MTPKDKLEEKDFLNQADRKTDPSAPAETIMQTVSSTDSSIPFGATIALNSLPGESLKTNVDDPQFTGINLTLDTGSKPAPRDGGRAVLHSRVGDYEILGELGRGGMGVVYRARHKQLGREVALKMILAGAHAGEEQQARFLLEAQAVAHLQHPNIVQIFDVGQQDNLPYFSLEFVDGKSLAEKLDHKPLPPNESAAMIEKLARAMKYAHDHGVLHRDLKPANVLLTGEGEPKITDFGLAKRLEEDDSATTRTGTIMGTPSYMAPEQARGDIKSIGPAADQYSLGSMLYELLTGRPPFMAAKPMETLLQVLQSEPVAPRQMQPRLPIDVETICLKALQKDPAKRYEHCGEFAEDLRRFQTGEPILARPVGRVGKIWRWCRRNPWVAVPSVAAIVLLITSAGVSLGAAIKLAAKNEIIVEERNNAQTAQRLAEINEKLAKTAEKSASENATIAGTQRKLALDTLHTVVTKVEQKLRDRPEMHGLRKDVLDTALDGLQKLSRTDENMAFADRTIGAAYQRMGESLLRAGRTENALDLYKRATAIFERLLRDDPNNDILKWNIGLCYEGLGDLGRKMGDDGQTIRANYERSLAKRELLANQTQRIPELRSAMIRASLINSYGRLGTISLELLGNPPGAHTFFSKARDQSEALFAELPKELVARQGLSGSYFVLGRTSFRLGDAEQARALIDKALTLRREILDQDPQSIKGRQDVAASLAELGDIELRSGNAQLALEKFREAHLIRVALFESDAENPEMQQDLSASHYRIGCGLLAAGDANAAAEPFAAALKLRQNVQSLDPQDTQKQFDLIMAQARCGMHVQASESTRELRERLFPNPGTLYSLALSYAVCYGAASAEPSGNPESSGGPAVAQQYATLAIEILSDAVQHGFADRVAMTTDADLNAIRDLPEFSAIVDGVK